MDQAVIEATNEARRDVGKGVGFADAIVFVSREYGVSPQAVVAEIGRRVGLCEKQLAFAKESKPGA
jgi:hypothetical protein